MEIEREAGRTLAGTWALAILAPAPARSRPRREIHGLGLPGVRGSELHPGASFRLGIG